MPDKSNKFIKDGSGLASICEAVANGGSLITYCEKNNLIYSKIVNWIYDDEGRQKSYEVALEARGEWVAQRVLLELKQLSFADRRQLFNEDGSIKDISEIPDDLAAAIAGIDIEECVEDDDGNVIKGRVRKMKLADKLKSIELLGKHLKMFTDKHEVTGAMSLEQLVVGSLKKPESEPEKKEPDSGKDEIKSEEEQADENSDQI